MINCKRQNPSKPGTYNIKFANVHTMLPLFADWDGEKWLNVKNSFGEMAGDMYFYDLDIELIKQPGIK